MALWKDTGSSSSPAAGGTPVPANPTVTELHTKPVERMPEPAAPPETLRRPAPAPRTAAVESLIAAELTIEGKISGAGDVRIAGRFKGDVQVDGNFRIDSGARLEGQVRAGVVVVGGELQGNIDAAKQVDVLATGIIVGDVKAASITVAAGSRMRGHVEFGWEEKHASDRPAAFELPKGTPRAV
jgi:cytoskeletal protein CcmA (bactofilin family)